MNNVRYNVFEVINMSRGLKNRTPISNAVDTKLYEQLKQLSKDTMIPMSRLLDRGIELVLKEYDKPTK